MTLPADAVSSRSLPAANGGLVKSADRTLAVLDLLADRGPMSFTELYTELGLPKSSALNLLRTMASRRYVSRDSAGKFALGLRVWQISEACTDVPDLRAVLRPLMERLRDATGETVQAAMLEGMEAIFFEIRESSHPIKIAARVGARHSAHACGVGKALLAELREEDLRRRLQRAALPAMTRNTIVDPDHLLAELAKIRRRGYATDNEEFAIGLRCVAMPVHGASRDSIVALSVAIPTPRYSARIAAQARGELADAVAAAGRHLRADVA